MRIVGIDWATEKKNRALVSLTTGTQAAVCEVLSSVSDEVAMQICRDDQNAVVAVDIPFGWPRKFSEFVATWSPTAATAAPPASDDFRLRQTDRVVKTEVPKEPLSVSADRIAMGARSWTALISKSDLAAQVDVEGKPKERIPTLIEVYPGATAIALGRDRQRLADEESYKSDPATRRALVKHVASAIGVSLGRFEDEIVSQGKDSDETDAFLAAVTGRIYAASQVGSLPKLPWTVRCPRTADEMEAARVEGWIFFPTPES